MDIVVSDVPEGGVDSSKLDGAAFLREVTIRLVGDRIPADRNAVVRRRLGGLLSVGLEQHFLGGQGAGARAEAEEENEEAWIGGPF